MSWDAFQREVLAELGHVPYLPLRAQAAVADIDLEIDIDAGMLARIARAAMNCAMDGAEAKASVTSSPLRSAVTALLRFSIWRCT